MNKEHNKSTTSMLLQSMISIIICCICLIGSTFAWFASETSAGVESVISSELGFDVSVTQKASGTQVNTESESLLSGNAYIINLSISDTSTATKGYCLITIDDADGSTIYYTPTFEKGVLESKTIELVVGKECKITVIPSWGAHSNETCGDKINHFAYNIVYDLDGGAVSVDNPTIYSLGNTITLNNPTKEGYEFIGWTGSNGKEPEKTVVVGPDADGDKNYTAVWQEISSYTITYNLVDGLFDVSAPFSYKNGETLTLPNPIKAGFEFVGWTGSNGEEPQVNVMIQNETGDKTYTAVWQEIVNPIASDEQTNDESNQEFDDESEEGLDGQPDEEQDVEPDIESEEESEVESEEEMDKESDTNSEEEGSDQGSDANLGEDSEQEFDENSEEESAKETEADSGEGQTPGDESEKENEQEVGSDPGDDSEQQSSGNPEGEGQGATDNGSEEVINQDQDVDQGDESEQESGVNEGDETATDSENGSDQESGDNSEEV